jgi:hypothetical protein
MKILLSIKPEYAEKILSGEKKFEFRRVLPKNKAIKKVVIYATLPIGKVVGEFEIEELISDSPSQLWERTAEFSGITVHFFNAYFDGRDTAYAIKVGKTKKYAKEKKLIDILPSGIAPQSFCYI